MSRSRAQRLFARRVSLRDSRTGPTGERAHLLVWAELPQWLVVDDELDSLIGQFDGRRTIDQIVGRHAKRWRKPKADVRREAVPVIADLIDRGILSASRPGPVARDEPVGIANVTINLTNRCNLRCPWCYNARRKQAEMPIEPFMDALAAGTDIYERSASLIILGGEPLLDWPRLEHVLDRSAAIFEPAPMLSTNGTLLSGEMVARLATRRVEVQVSLDGSSAARHDAVRGAGVFDQAVTGIQRLVDAGVTTIMSMVYTRETVADFEAYLDLARELRVDEARFIPLRLVGGALEHAAELPDQHAALEHLLAILARRPELGSLLRRDYFTIVHTIFRFASRRTSCGIGRKVLFVDADGAVYPCPNHVDARHRAGRLQEQSLQAILEDSEVMRAVRERYRVSQYRRCRSCPFRHWCAGDCRGEVLAVGADLAEPSPHCDELRKMYLRILWLLADGDARLGAQRDLGDGRQTADTFV